MSGMLGHIGLAKESTWGTAVAADAYIEALSESIVTTIERFETRNIVGGFFEADDETGVARHEGDLVFAAHPENLGHILNGVFGVNTVTSLGNGLFTNEMSPTQSFASSEHPLPPYTLEVFRPGAVSTNTSFQYAGAQFSTVELALAPNQDLRVTGSVIAKTRNMIAKTTATFPTSPSGVFTYDVTSVSFGGTAVGARLESLTFAIDNQLEGVPALNNDTEIAKVRRTGMQQIRISGTLEFDDFTDFDDFTSQTEQQIIATLTMTDSFQLVFDAPRAVFSEYPVQIPGRDRLTVDFTMMARYHTGSNNAFLATLTTTNTF